MRIERLRDAVERVEKETAALLRATQELVRRSSAPKSKGGKRHGGR